MSKDPGSIPPLQSLMWATDLDVLPAGRVIERRDACLLIRSPTNPTHFYGNLLLFDEPPAPGDGLAWEARFDSEFADEPRVRHRTFGWVEPSLGAAHEEFVARGYELEEDVGLIAAADEIHRHPRENSDAIVRPLEADDPLWSEVLELEVTSRDEGHPESDFRAFAAKRLRGLRAHFEAGRGAWYVALDPVTGELAASCGLVVTEGRARYQSVITALAHRRRGMCSRLVVAAAHHAAETHGAKQFVIVADADYHARGLYESLGFQPHERAYSVCHWEKR